MVRLMLPSILCRLMSKSMLRCSAPFVRQATLVSLSLASLVSLCGRWGRLQGFQFRKISEDYALFVDNLNYLTRESEKFGTTLIHLLDMRLYFRVQDKQERVMLTTWIRREIPPYLTHLRLHAPTSRLSSVVKMEEFFDRHDNACFDLAYFMVIWLCCSVFSGTNWILCARACSFLLVDWRNGSTIIGGNRGRDRKFSTFPYITSTALKVYALKTTSLTRIVVDSRIVSLSGYSVIDLLLFVFWVLIQRTSLHWTLLAESIACQFGYSQARVGAPRDFGRMGTRLDRWHSWCDFFAKNMGYSFQYPYVNSSFSESSVFAPCC